MIIFFFKYLYHTRGPHYWTSPTAAPATQKQVLGPHHKARPHCPQSTPWPTKLGPRPRQHALQLEPTCKTRARMRFEITSARGSPQHEVIRANSLALIREASSSALCGAGTGRLGGTLLGRRLLRSLFFFLPLYFCLKQTGSKKPDLNEFLIWEKIVWRKKKNLKKNFKKFRST